jgi:hypothetical protein
MLPNVVLPLASALRDCAAGRAAGAGERGGARATGERREAPDCEQLQRETASDHAREIERQAAVRRVAFLVVDGSDSFPLHEVTLDAPAGTILGGS